MAEMNAPVEFALDDGVATIRMADADRANALSADLVDGLREAFAAAHAREATAIVICGLAEMFSSGAAPEVLAGFASGEVPLAELDLPLLLIDAPIPVIAAMAGDAIGGGFVLGLAADIVILAEESRYGFNFMDFGLTPGMGATALARHFLNPGPAEELLMTGEFRRGRNIRPAAGINHIVARERVEPTAFDIAARIADKPRYAVSALKSRFATPRRDAFLAARRAEDAMHRLCLCEEETLERIRTANARSV